MTRTLFILFLALLPLLAHTQEDSSAIDPVAITILDRMSSILSSLTSCTFTVETSQDIPDETFFVPQEDIGLVKQFGVHEVSFSGNNRFQVNSTNDKGHFGYWFNGEYVAYYSYSNNHFGVVEADSTSLATIYYLNENYNVEFPAADFFNPRFTDDLMEFSERILFLGERTLQGNPCFHILAKLEGMSVQIWVNNDATLLPLKLVINYLDREDNPQYEATFRDWTLNPDLPDAMFDFVPPVSATVLTFVPNDQD